MQLFYVPFIVGHTMIILRIIAEFSKHYTRFLEQNKSYLQGRHWFQFVIRIRDKVELLNFKNILFNLIWWAPVEHTYVLISHFNGNYKTWSFNSHSWLKSKCNMGWNAIWVLCHISYYPPSSVIGLFHCLLHKISSIRWGLIDINWVQIFFNFEFHQFYKSNFCYWHHW